MQTYQIEGSLKNIVDIIPIQVDQKAEMIDKTF